MEVYMIIAILYIPFAFSASDDDSERSKYKRMGVGSLCSGSFKLISRVGDCIRAAEALKLQYEDVWNGTGDFPGCLYADDGRGRVYFNVSPRPSRRANNPKYTAICHQINGPAEGNYNSNFAENVESLTSHQTGKLLEAMKDFEDSPGWKKVTEIHGSPLNQKECGDTYCSIHDGAGGFLPWHRLYIQELDHHLQKHDPSVVMPYWDWTTAQIPKIATPPTIRNPVTEKDMENPLFKGFIPYQNRSTNRNISVIVNLNTRNKLEKILTALGEDDYILFALQLQFIHNDVHDYVGGDMFYLTIASYDPVFYMIHSMVDLLWEVYRTIHPSSSVSTMPQKLLPQELLPWKKNVAQTLELSNRYNLDFNSDRIVFGGMNLSEIKSAVERRKKENKVFAGFLLESMGASGRIHFDICLKDDCSYGNGTVVILGGEKEKPFINTNPMKVDVTEDVKKSGIKNEDMKNVRFTVTQIETIKGASTPLTNISAPMQIFRDYNYKTIKAALTPLNIFEPMQIFRDGKTGEEHLRLSLSHKRPKQFKEFKVPKAVSGRVSFNSPDQQADGEICERYDSCKPCKPIHFGKETKLQSGEYTVYDNHCSTVKFESGKQISKFKIIVQ